MSSNKKYAILDTDFISKMYITRKDENSQLIKLIVQIEDFDFICHNQTLVELQRHNSDAANWLQKEKSITVYSDLDLITLLENIYNKSAFYLFANLLKTSCDVFSSNYYNTHYQELDKYLSNPIDTLNVDGFVSKISSCDSNIGTGNNLGEIKLYTIAQVLETLGNNQLYVFCSDDRKACYTLNGQSNFECVRALGAFYLAKNYLLLSKDEAKSYYDSWMAFHIERNQDSFKMYLEKNNQLQKVDGYNIFNMLYNNELKLLKNGHFCKNDLNE